jgi:hypothetical protein
MYCTVLILVRSLRNPAGIDRQRELATCKKLGLESANITFVEVKVARSKSYKLMTIQTGSLERYVAKEIQYPSDRGTRETHPTFTTLNAMRLQIITLFST